MPGAGRERWARSGGILKYSARLLLFLMLMSLAATVSGQQSGPLKPAVPVDAITAILDAFRSHSVVALGEGPHGNEQGHAFRLALIRDPRFTNTVNDIMVEFGSGRYQDLMDRFVSGEDVPYEDLRHVWQDTTVDTSVWEKPVYEEFFRAIRALNMSLSPARRLRVLLGDAPIDWDLVKTREDASKWGMAKDGYAGNLVKKEVLAKQRRVLVIYGDGHLQGRGFPQGSLINVLERRPNPTKVFAISSAFTDLTKMQADAASWPIPSIARIQGTVIGGRPYASFYQLPPGPGWNAVKMEDQFDAVLYLGPASSVTMSRFPPELCFDSSYMKMRLGRMALGHPMVSAAGIESLKMYCAAQTSK